MYSRDAFNKELINFISLTQDTQKNIDLNLILNANQKFKFDKCSNPIKIIKQNHLRIYLLYKILKTKIELNQKEDILKNDRYNGKIPAPELYSILKENDQQEQILHLTDYMLNCKELFLQAYYQILEAELDFLQKKNYEFETTKYDIKSLKDSIQFLIKGGSQNLTEPELICLNQAFSINFKQLIFSEDQQGYHLDEQNYVNFGIKGIQITWLIVYHTSLIQLQQPILYFLSEGKTKKKKFQILASQGNPTTKKQSEQIQEPQGAEFNQIVKSGSEKKKKNMQIINPKTEDAQNQHTSDQFIMQSMDFQNISNQPQMQKKKELPLFILQESQQKIAQVLTALPAEHNLKKILHVPKVSEEISYQCQSCGENINQNGIELSCSHMIHQYCLAQYVQQLFNDQRRNFEQYKCPISQCRGLIGVPILKQYFSLDQIQEINQLQLVKNHQQQIIHCPSKDCGGEFFCSTTDKQLELNCRLCNKNFCSLCKQLYHGQNGKGELCPQEMKNIFEAIRNLPRGVCPKCNIPYLQNDDCNEDDAICEVCNQQFCKSCYAPWEQIRDHGNYYHRKGCCNYQPLMNVQTNQEILIADYYEEGCTTCNQTKQACPRPTSLDQFKAQCKWFTNK